jgi:hypothetical protein
MSAAGQTAGGARVAVDVGGNAVAVWSTSSGIDV